MHSYSGEESVEPGTKLRPPANQFQPRYLQKRENWKNLYNKKNQCYGSGFDGVPGSVSGFAIRIWTQEGIDDPEK
jgi:hypothetical protein